jgi:ribosome-associated protein
MNTAERMTESAVQALEEKKGVDIQVIDIAEISTIADFFVLATGNNRSQIQAMADEVEEKMHKAGHLLGHTEGYDGAAWILMDFHDIIVHIFDRESRQFYDLERIYRDGKMLDLEALRATENRKN